MPSTWRFSKAGPSSAGHFLKIVEQHVFQHSADFACSLADFRPIGNRQFTPSARELRFERSAVAALHARPFYWLVHSANRRALVSRIRKFTGSSERFTSPTHCTGMSRLSR